MDTYNPKTRKAQLTKTISTEKELGFNPEIIREHERQLQELEKEIRADKEQRKNYQQNKETEL